MQLFYVIILYIVLQYYDKPYIKDTISMNTINFYDIFQENKDKIHRYLSPSYTTHRIYDNLFAEDIKGKIIIITSGAARLGTIDAGGTSSVVQYFTENFVILDSFMEYTGNITYILTFTAPSEIVLFQADKLTNVMADAEFCPVFFNALTEGIKKSVRERNIHTAVTSCRSIQKKLTEYFSYLKYEKSSVSFKIPISMAELADYLCIDRSAMMRELSNMQKKGLLTSKNRNITLLV